MEVECWCVHCDRLDCIWITLPPHNILVRVKLTERPERNQLYALLSASCKQPVFVVLKMLYWEHDAYVSEFLNVIPPQPMQIIRKNKTFISQSMHHDRDESRVGVE
jgi:hypothetical protein